MISENLIIRIEALPLEDKKTELNTLLEITNKKISILQSGKVDLPFIVGTIKSLKRDVETLESLINSL